MNDDFTLEKLKIDTRLEKVESAIQDMLVEVGKISTYLDGSKLNCQKSMDEVSRLLNRQNETLYGNGNDGLILNVDRLMTQASRRAAHYIVIYTALIGIILEAVYIWFKNMTVHIFQK